MFSKKNKKTHLLPRLIVGIFMAIAAAQTIAAVGAFNAPEMAFAQSDEFKAQVPIPGAKIEFDKSTRPIAQYVKAVYTYAVGAVGILATVMLMIGGLRWILAGGNPSSIGEAKDMILAAISGMVLVMTSYLILSQINPALVNLESNVAQIEMKTDSTKTATSANPPRCEWVTQTANILASGCVKGDDTQCTGSKEGINSPSCCCKYDPVSSNCKWSDSKCGEGEKMINDAGTARINEESIKTCGSTFPSGDNGYCCCAAGASCPTGSNIKCDPCPTCIQLSSSICTESSIRHCQVTPSMADKIKKANEEAAIAGVSWEITEAWPPVVNHGSGGHANGNSVDLAPRSRADDVETVSTIFSNLTATFGQDNVVYECYTSSDCCKKYEAEGVKCGQYATGAAAGGKSHFHVNN